MSTATDGGKSETVEVYGPPDLQGRSARPDKASGGTTLPDIALRTTQRTRNSE